METSYKTPEELKILTEKNRPDTSSFIKKLKKKKPKNLDEVTHNLHNKAFEQFNCLSCANCCKTIGPRITDKDIERLAKYLKIKPGEFINQYVVNDEDNDFVFKQHPCPFLLPDNFCLVYENRPRACREYPHTNRRKFVQILELSHKNCETCPMVFEIFEQLKKNKW